jgi:hypothetical protein
MRQRPLRLLPLAALAVLAVAALAAQPACSGAGQHRVVHPLDQPVEARALVVYPFAFRWEEPPQRSLLLGTATAEALGAKDRLPVIGPAEFTIFRQDADDPRVGTDLPGAMAQRHLPATAFVALRAWAEKRVERTTAEIDGKGLVRSSEAVTFVEHLELLDGGGRGILLELEGQAPRDPNLASDPWDPTPELTRLHRELTERAWAALAPRLTAAPLPPLPAQVRWLPAAAIAWAPPGQRSLAQRLEGADAVEADLQRLAVYGFADPAASDAELGRRRRLPGGLLVERVEGTWAGALRPGDVIVEVAGEPASGSHTLRRVMALARARRADVELAVVRDGARRTVSLSPP